MMTNDNISNGFRHANAPMGVVIPGSWDRRTPTPPSQWHIDNPRYVPNGGNNRRTPSTPGKPGRTIH